MRTSMGSVRKGGTGTMYGNPNSLPGLGGNNGQRRFQQRPPPAPSPQPPMFSQPAPMPMPMPDTGSARRIDALEQRLMAAEQANRSLLDELMRMQQETKVNVKKNEHSLTEERDSRGRLEMAIRATQAKMAELEERQGRTEAALKESRSAIQSLVMHTKNVERAVMTSSGETRDRRDQTMSRLQELRHEVSGLNQSKDTLDRMTHTLREDVRDLHMKVENLQGDVQAVDHTMKLQTRMMEEGSRKNMQGSGGGGGMSNSVAMALEAKVMKLQQNVMDVNSRLVHDAKNRDMSEQQQTERINDVWSELGEVKRRREDDLRELELKTREMSSMTGSEKKRLQMAISSIQNDLETKLRANDAAGRGDKMQGETGERVRQLERSMEEEVTARTTREKALRDEVEKKLDEIKIYSDEGLNGIRKMTEAQQDQTRQRFKELSDGLNLLEGSFNEDKLETEQKLNKEAQERENLEKVMDAKVDDLSDRLRIGMASLQSALGEANTRGGTGSSGPGLSIDEIERLQNSNNEGVREQMAKSIADVDSKIASLRTRVEQQDEVIENKIKQAERSDDNESNMMGDKLTQKMDSVMFAQERLKRQVDQLEDTVKECPRDIAEVKEQLQETESRLDKKLDQETRDRTEDIEDVRRDLGRLAGNEETAGGTSLARVQQDVDDTQTSITKLAEAMQIIKVTLSEKVKEEKKMREQETEVLKRDVDRLDAKTKDLKDRIKHPKAYKKKKQVGAGAAVTAVVVAGATGLAADDAVEAVTDLDDLGQPSAEETDAPAADRPTSAPEGDGEREPDVPSEDPEPEETPPQPEETEEKEETSEVEEAPAPDEVPATPEDEEAKEEAAEPAEEATPEETQADEEEAKPEKEPENQEEKDDPKPEEENKPEEEENPGEEPKPEEESKPIEEEPKPEEEVPKPEEEDPKPEDEEPKPEEAAPQPKEDADADEPPPADEGTPGDAGGAAADPSPDD